MMDFSIKLTGSVQDVITQEKDKDAIQDTMTMIANTMDHLSTFKRLMGVQLAEIDLLINKLSNEYESLDILMEGPEGIKKKYQTIPEGPDLGSGSRSDDSKA